MVLMDDAGVEAAKKGNSKLSVMMRGSELRGNDPNPWKTARREGREARSESPVQQPSTNENFGDDANGCDIWAIFHELSLILSRKLDSGIPKVPPGVDWCGLREARLGWMGNYRQRIQLLAIAGFNGVCLFSHCI